MACCVQQLNTFSEGCVKWNELLLSTLLTIFRSESNEFSSSCPDWEPSPTQQREPNRGNQNVATVSQSEAAAIRSAIEKASEPPVSNDARIGSFGPSAANDVGFFYLIQLEPEHDSGRFKLGFTMDLDGRLQKHRCSAPFAK